MKQVVGCARLHFTLRQLHVHMLSLFEFGFRRQMYSDYVCGLFLHSLNRGAPKDRMVEHSDPNRFALSIPVVIFFGISDLSYYRVERWYTFFHK